jgi:hypothetical protein
VQDSEFAKLCLDPKYYWGYKTKEDEMGGVSVTRTGEMGNAYKMLVGKFEEKRPLGRRRRRWEDNIRIDLREIG